MSIYIYIYDYIRHNRLQCDILLCYRRLSHNLIISYCFKVSFWGRLTSWVYSLNVFPGYSQWTTSKLPKQHWKLKIIWLRQYWPSNVWVSCLLSGVYPNLYSSWIILKCSSILGRDSEKDDVKKPLESREVITVPFYICPSISYLEYHRIIFPHHCLSLYMQPSTKCLTFLLSFEGQIAECAKAQPWTASHRSKLWRRRSRWDPLTIQRSLRDLM